jgi:hypothetical protein
MTEKMRRALAWAAVAVGVALGFVSAGPLTWGLGVVVAVALVVGGAAVLTDRRPAHVRAGRPYDRARDR